MEVFNSFLPLAGTLVVAAIAAIIAFLAGRRLQVSKLKLPVIDFELIDGETPDLFRELTMLIHEAQYTQVEELEELGSGPIDFRLEA